jgi:hypothetical protein
MSKARSTILIAAMIVAVSTPIVLQRMENRRLVQELAATRAQLESQQATSSAPQVTDEGAQQKLQELESEVIRLRNVASRVTRAEAENAQLRTEVEQQRGRKSSDSTDATAANPDALVEYLGAAIEPPANLDPAYSKDGLLGAIQLASQKAGVAPKRVEVETSEFPFLTAVICGPGEWEKFKAELKNMQGYQYFGAVGNDTCNSFCIVPFQASEGGQRIARRVNVRMQLFYDKIHALEN